MEINKDEVGFRISNIRKRLGLNQELFGQKINLAHKSLVSKWEKGQSLPNNERLKMIAELGGISVDELLYGSTWEYAKRKISDICLKFHISDAYFYMIFNNFFVSKIFSSLHTLMVFLPSNRNERILLNSLKHLGKRNGS